MVSLLGQPSRDGHLHCFVWWLLATLLELYDVSIRLVGGTISQCSDNVTATTGISSTICHCGSILPWYCMGSSGKCS